MSATSGGMSVNVSGGGGNGSAAISSGSMISGGGGGSVVIGSSSIISGGGNGNSAISSGSMISSGSGNSAISSSSIKSGEGSGNAAISGGGMIGSGGNIGARRIVGGGSGGGGGGGGSMSEGSETGESSQSTMSVNDSPSTSFQASHHHHHHHNHDANITKINLADEDASGAVHIDMAGSRMNLTLDERQSGDGVVNMGFDNAEGANRGDADFKSINGSVKADKVPEAVNLELVNMVPYSNGNGTNYGVPVNGIPVKKDSEGADMSSPYDEYFVPVNEHKKYMRGEKLYVTKDKRRPASWRKCLSWIVACGVLSAVLIIAILAGTGVISSQDSNAVKEASVGRNFAGADTKHLVTEGSAGGPADKSFGLWMSETNNGTHMYVPRLIELELPVDNYYWNPAYLNISSAEYKELMAATEPQLKRILFDKEDLDFDGTDLGFKMINASRDPFRLFYRMGWNFKQGDNDPTDPITMEDVQKRLVEGLTKNQGYIDKYHIDTKEIHVGQVINVCQTNNGGCSHICYYNYLNQQFTCTCPTNLVLDKSMKTCVEWSEPSEQDYASVPSRTSYPDVQFNSNEKKQDGHGVDHSHHHESDHAHEHGSDHVHNQGPGHAGDHESDQEQDHGSDHADHGSKNIHDHGSAYSNDYHRPDDYHDPESGYAFDFEHHQKSSKNEGDNRFGLNSSGRPSGSGSNSDNSFESEPAPEPTPEPVPDLETEDGAHSHHEDGQHHGVIVNPDATSVTQVLRHQIGQQQSNIEVISPHDHQHYHPHQYHAGAHGHESTTAPINEDKHDKNSHSNVNQNQDSGFPNHGGSISEDAFSHNDPSQSSADVKYGLHSHSSNPSDSEKLEKDRDSPLLDNGHILHTIPREGHDAHEQTLYQTERPDSTQATGHLGSDNQDSTGHHVPLLEDILLEDSSRNSTEHRGSSLSPGRLGHSTLEDIKIDEHGKPIVEEVVIDKSGPQSTEQNGWIPDYSSSSDRNLGDDHHRSKENPKSEENGKIPASAVKGSSNERGTTDSYEVLAGNTEAAPVPVDYLDVNNRNSKPGSQDSNEKDFRAYKDDFHSMDGSDRNQNGAFETQAHENPENLDGKNDKEDHWGQRFGSSSQPPYVTRGPTTQDDHQTTVNSVKKSPVPINVHSDFSVDEPEPKIKTRIDHQGRPTSDREDHETRTEIPKMAAYTDSPNHASNSKNDDSVSTSRESKEKGNNAGVHSQDSDGQPKYYENGKFLGDETNTKSPEDISSKRIHDQALGQNIDGRGTGVVENDQSKHDGTVTGRPGNAKESESESEKFDKSRPHGASQGIPDDSENQRSSTAGNQSPEYTENEKYYQTEFVKGNVKAEGNQSTSSVEEHEKPKAVYTNVKSRPDETDGKRWEIKDDQSKPATVRFEQTEHDYLNTSQSDKMAERRPQSSENDKSESDFSSKEKTNDAEYSQRGTDETYRGKTENSEDQSKNGEMRNKEKSEITGDYIKSKNIGSETPENVENKHSKFEETLLGKPGYTESNESGRDKISKGKPESEDSERGSPHEGHNSSRLPEQGGVGFNLKRPEEYNEENAGDEKSKNDKDYSFGHEVSPKKVNKSERGESVIYSAGDHEPKSSEKTSGTVKTIYEVEMTTLSSFDGAKFESTGKEDKRKDESENPEKSTEHFHGSRKQTNNSQESQSNPSHSHSDEFSNNIKDEGVDNDEFNMLLDKEYKNQYSSDGKENFNKYPGKQTFSKGDKKKIKEHGKANKTETDGKTTEDSTKPYLTSKHSASPKPVTGHDLDLDYHLLTEHTTSVFNRETNKDNPLSGDNIPVLTFNPHDGENPDYGILYTVSPGYETEAILPYGEDESLLKLGSVDGHYDSKEEEFRLDKDSTKQDKDLKYDKQKGGKKKDLKKKGGTKDGKNVELDDGRKYYSEITSDRGDGFYSEGDQESARSFPVEKEDEFRTIGSPAKDKNTSVYSKLSDGNTPFISGSIPSEQGRETIMEPAYAKNSQEGSSSVRPHLHGSESESNKTPGFGITKTNDQVDDKLSVPETPGVREKNLEHAGNVKNGDTNEKLQKGLDSKLSSDPTGTTLGRKQGIFTEEELPDDSDRKNQRDQHEQTISAISGVNNQNIDKNQGFGIQEVSEKNELLTTSIKSSSAETTNRMSEKHFPVGGASKEYDSINGGSGSSTIKTGPGDNFDGSTETVIISGESGNQPGHLYSEGKPVTGDSSGTPTYHTEISGSNKDLTSQSYVIPSSREPGQDLNAAQFPSETFGDGKGPVWELVNITIPGGGPALIVGNFSVKTKNDSAGNRPVLIRNPDGFFYDNKGNRIDPANTFDSFTSEKPSLTEGVSASKNESIQNNPSAYALGPDGFLYDRQGNKFDPAKVFDPTISEAPSPIESNKATSSQNASSSENKPALAVGPGGYLYDRNGNRIDSPNSFVPPTSVQHLRNHTVLSNNNNSSPSDRPEFTRGPDGYLYDNKGNRIDPSTAFIIGASSFDFGNETATSESGSHRPIFTKGQDGFLYDNQGNKVDPSNAFVATSSSGNSFVDGNPVIVTVNTSTENRPVFYRGPDGFLYDHHGNKLDPFSGLISSSSSGVSSTIQGDPASRVGSQENRLVFTRGPDGFLYDNRGNRIDPSNAFVAPSFIAGSHSIDSNHSSGNRPVFTQGSDGFLYDNQGNKINPSNAFATSSNGQSFIIGNRTFEPAKGFSAGNRTVFYRGPDGFLYDRQGNKFNSSNSLFNSSYSLESPAGHFNGSFDGRTVFRIQNGSLPGTVYDGRFNPQDGRYHVFSNSSGTFAYTNTQPPSFVIKGKSGDFGRSAVYILGNGSRSNEFFYNGTSSPNSHQVIFKNSTIYSVRNGTKTSAPKTSYEVYETSSATSNGTLKQPFQLTPSSLAAGTVYTVSDSVGYISKCAAGQFQCLNGTSKRGSACINLSSKCDSINDCSDGSDEAGCIENGCPGNFQCSDGTCLKRHLVCNGIVECSDGSDEKQCENWKCEFDELKCPSGRCIPVVWRCDGKADCDNHTDEQNCQRSCGNDEYLCPEGWCIPSTYKCNGVKECSNGEDELFCDCSLDEFKCNSGGCIQKNQVCNGLDDCPDRSDEWNCMRLLSNSTVLQIRTSSGKFEPVCSDNWTPTHSDHVCASVGYSSSVAVESESPSSAFKAKPHNVLKNGTFIRDGNNFLVNLIRTNNTCYSRKWVEISCQEFACGSRSMTDSSSAEGRLVGGMGATTGQWPSVALLYNVRNMHSCTANIITPRWVLASYVCLKMGHKNINIKDWKLFGGSTVFEAERESGERRTIAAIVPHPQVKFNQFLFSNDLALVKLNEPLPFSNTVGAVCLPEREIQPRQICVTAGWGMNGPEDKSIRQQLQYLPVPTMNLTECNSTEHYSGFVTEDKICAGYNPAEKSLCYNEEGAPLMCVNDRGEWELQGMLSYHSNCGRGSHPSIFSGIKPIKDWIKHTIGNSVDRKRSSLKRR